MSNTSDRGASGKSPLSTPHKAFGAPSPGDIGAQGAGTIRNGGASKEQAGNVAESAKDLASKAGEKLLSSVEEQKAAGADFVSGMAGSIRRAAREFDQELPQAGHYIRLAADQIDNVSDAVRKRDLNQVVSDVQGFARRQPTAFLGAAVLAGFALVRFLKTSTAGASTASGPARVPQAGRPARALNGQPQPPSKRTDAPRNRL